MILPLNINRVEQLEIDPQKKIDGYIWYNNVEQVYKTYIDQEAHIFITNKKFEADIKKFEADITDLVNNALSKHQSKHQFTITFSDVYKVIIKHNKNTKHFNYNVFDLEENCNLSCSLEIINENEVAVEFVDPVTGYIFMYFE